MLEEDVPDVQSTSHTGCEEDGWSAWAPAAVSQWSVVVRGPHYGRLFCILRPQLEGDDTHTHTQDGELISVGAKVDQNTLTLEVQSPTDMKYLG